MRGSSQAATFWNDDLESHAAVRVVCVPVGFTPPRVFERYLRALRASPRVPLAAITRGGNVHRHSTFTSSLSSLSSVSSASSSSVSSSSSSSSSSISSMTPTATEAFLKRAPHPFASARDHNSLRFDFIESGSVLLPSPFLDLQPHRKALAVVGICHCPSTPDIASMFNAMEARMQKVAADQGQDTVWRCLAFDVSDEQLRALQTRTLSPQSVSLLVRILPDRRLENGHSMQSMMLRNALSNLGSELFANFHCTVALGLAGKLTTMPRLSTASDAKVKEKMKASRWAKRLGYRMALWAAEYCLLAG